ncbi:MAG: YfiR family protein [Porticoccus sp.]|nr:YfiR family protein [Porticoccus sp.]MBQ0806398.1 YfiR family protein [Porticoccus sp.]
MSKSIKKYSAALLFLMIYCCSLSAGSLSKEYQIKSAILIKLTKFVFWDNLSGSTSPINFCLLQPEPFGLYIDEVAKQDSLVSKSHPLMILRVDNGDDISHCHVLFMPKKSLLLKGIHARDTVFITEGRSTIDSDNHINLYTNNGQIKFEINIDNIRRDKIKMRAQLLSVATIVKNTGTKP